MHSFVDRLPGYFGLKLLLWKMLFNKSQSSLHNECIMFKSLLIGIRLVHAPIKKVQSERTLGNGPPLLQCQRPLNARQAVSHWDDAMSKEYQYK